MDQALNKEEQTEQTESTNATAVPAAENETATVTDKKPEAQWYVVHTYSGYENKVKATLTQVIQNRGLEDLIQEVSVPTEEQVEIKDGKRHVYERKVYPGYVLLKMVMSDELWYIVRNTRGVTGFVGPDGDPIPLTAE